jgi:signal transduction histidine kinase
VSGLLDNLKAGLHESERYHAQLQEMSSRVLTAHEAERKRIARELHDDTGQVLTSILVRLRLLELSSSDPEVLSNVQELRELTAGALDSVRRLAVDLRPAALDDLGLGPALQAYVDRYSRTWPIATTVEVDGLKRRLPADVELVLYRVVQEALTNVAKHSRASQVKVSLRRRRNEVTVSIEDNGVGFDADHPADSDTSHLGIFGMRERLTLVGGDVEVVSTKGGGARVVARVPLSVAAPKRRRAR